MSKFKKVVIIGANAAGASCASRLRRLDENLNIVVFEKTDTPSFAFCGMPYFIGGKVEEIESLGMTSVPLLKNGFDLDLRINTEVTKIDKEKREVTAKNLKTGEVCVESYDRLVFATGSNAFIPPTPGLKVDSECVFTLKSKSDMVQLSKKAEKSTKCGVVGGGFIGIEVAEQLAERGKKVTVIEMLPHVIPPLDSEMANIVHKELKGNGVRLECGRVLNRVEKKDGHLECYLMDIKTKKVSETPLILDFLIVSTGLRPNTGLLKDAGVELSPKGSVVVNDGCQSKSNPEIYACGDCVTTKSRIMGNDMYVPLANNAVIHGRTAACHMMGVDGGKIKGTIQTGIFKCFGKYVGLMGFSEDALTRWYPNVQFKTLYHIDWHRPEFMPFEFDRSKVKNPPITIKLIFTAKEGKILGCQIIGEHGVKTLVCAMSLALSSGLTVEDLATSEMPYSPFLGNPRSVFAMMGMAAEGIIKGTHKMVYMKDVLGKDDVKLIDIRTKENREQTGTIPGAEGIPFFDIRGMTDKLKKLQEEDNSKRLILFSNSGRRAYWAQRALEQKGVNNVFALSGSWLLYERAYKED